MINPIINDIKEETRKIEKQEKVKVLFLIESGSRAWGWASEDSDYDIRGVFVQDYTNFNLKDQITKTIGDLDIVLWDLKKFLKLMLNSNPSVWEWLSSELIYAENSLRKELMKMFMGKFSPYKLKKHYLSMARQNFEKYINTGKETANLKKYVYVLRSVACVLFIEKNNLPPPKDYKKIIKYLPKNIQEFFEKIIKNKTSSESTEGKRNKEVDSYIVSFWHRTIEKAESKFNENKLEMIFKEQAKKFRI